MTSTAPERITDRLRPRPGGALRVFQSKGSAAEFLASGVDTGDSLQNDQHPIYAGSALGERFGSLNPEGRRSPQRTNCLPDRLFRQRNRAVRSLVKLLDSAKPRISLLLVAATLPRWIFRNAARIVRIASQECSMLAHHFGAN